LDIQVLEVIKSSFLKERARNNLYNLPLTSSFERQGLFSLNVIRTNLILKEGGGGGDKIISCTFLININNFLDK